MIRPRNRTLAIAWKEFLHIIHDPKSLFIIFLLPVVQLVMFGYALRMEIQNVKLAVIDYDQTVHSKHLIEQFTGSRFFNVSFYDQPLSHAEELFFDRKAHVIMIIPPDFGKKLNRDPFIPVQVLIDAVDPNAAINIKNYMNQTIQLFNQQHGYQIPLPFEVRSSIWFNPDLKSTFFFVPGLVALLLVMISALLTSITITREKEMGTMEQILVSPIKPGEIILGKVIPYIFIALLIGAIIIILGIVFFGVPFKGNALLLVFMMLLYITAALSIGLLISTIVKTQQVAMMASLIATMLPTIFLSGFFFPINSMPKVLQIISYIIPAKYFLIIVRGIMLKGNTFMQLLTPALFLILMSVILLIVALKKFNLKLEN